MNVHIFFLKYKGSALEDQNQALKVSFNLGKNNELYVPTNNHTIYAHDPNYICIYMYTQPYDFMDVSKSLIQIV